MDFEADLDNSCHKRTSSPPSDLNIGGRSKKISMDSSVRQSDSLTSGEPNKILYALTDNPPYIVHVYSLNSDPSASTSTSD